MLAIAFHDVVYYMRLVSYLYHTGQRDQELEISWKVRVSPWSKSYKYSMVQGPFSVHRLRSCQPVVYPCQKLYTCICIFFCHLPGSSFHMRQWIHPSRPGLKSGGRHLTRVSYVIKIKLIAAPLKFYKLTLVLRMYDNNDNRIMLAAKHIHSKHIWLHCPLVIYSHSDRQSLSMKNSSTE